MHHLTHNGKGLSPYKHSPLDGAHFDVNCGIMN